MTSDPRPKQDGNTGSMYRANLSPAQVIAEAWRRESPQSQEFWRQAEAKRKELYTAPRSHKPRGKI
ncbi:uncharacterized protein HD556DRAFT_1250004 [Suillus plorans]|uniref:Uncharacterized protein n=1 Tax=Suillus plorans TaxID=116603 RepID=A0A9P7DAD9_9AGAM|nr:uncharacterized protein HD556DRAFT_1250004 [Suillus plorans]KAG1785369.1 hypothetical protein HD556DRAFT_1250004 [Suillus plorans]KAG1848153.1 hypothetical protein C8R48DRAFT_410501 [Suillus tomentosus]